MLQDYENKMNLSFRYWKISGLVIGVCCLSASGLCLSSSVHAGSSNREFTP